MKTEAESEKVSAYQRSTEEGLLGRDHNKFVQIGQAVEHQWQPTPVFLPGKSHGRRSLVGHSPRGRKESDTTERLHFHFHFVQLDKTKDLFTSRLWAEART